MLDGEFRGRIQVGESCRLEVRIMPRSKSSPQTKQDPDLRHRELLEERDRLKKEVATLKRQCEKLQKALPLVKWEEFGTTEEEVLACVGRQPTLRQLIAELDAESRK